MVLDRRVQYKRINSWRTRSNRIRPVKTPGKLQPCSLILFDFRWQTRRAIYPKEGWREESWSQETQIPSILQTRGQQENSEQTIRRSAQP